MKRTDVNTGFYVMQPTYNSLLLLRFILYLLNKDEKNKYHDQKWGQIVMSGNFNISIGVFPWENVCGKYAEVTCNTILYHAIYTRDYVEKLKFMQRAVTRTRNKCTNHNFTGLVLP